MTPLPPDDSSQPLPHPRHHVRAPTVPLAHSIRRKPRRLPLVLRLSSGAVHSSILLPVMIHCLFTTLVVVIDTKFKNVGLPSTIVPSLSIVVGLMLVFRNGTSYDRFWTGRNAIATCGTSVRNLMRSILTCARGKDGKRSSLTAEEKADTERTVKALIAVLYAIKHNLRAEYAEVRWRDVLPTSEPNGTDGAASVTFTDDDGDVEASQSTLIPETNATPSRRPSLFYRGPPTRPSPFPSLATHSKPDYIAFLPPNMPTHETFGLSLPLQLLVLVEGYIARAHNRGHIHAPQASQLTVQLNTLVDAYSRMETIRTTPIPVAHLIHAKQVLALYTLALPFAVVDSYRWYAVPVVGMVAFTLYGIEGIGRQLEDPFGYDRNDIKMDGIVEDWRVECEVLFEEWGSGGREGVFGLGWE